MKMLRDDMRFRKEMFIALCKDIKDAVCNNKGKSFTEMIVIVAFISSISVYAIPIMYTKLVGLIDLSTGKLDTVAELKMGE